MKRVLCLLLIACSIHVWGQDFASKFMEQCAKEDGDIQCQTVSPIMMEKLMDTMTAPDGDRDEGFQYGFFFQGGFALPIAFQKLFYVLIVHILVFLCTFV